MKKNLYILLFILSVIPVFAQKSEKVKGTRNLTTVRREIGNFTSIEIDDNIEATLEIGDKPEIKIEADDNLQDVIATEVKNEVLNVYTLKDITRFKKLHVRITYTQNLVLVTSRNESSVSATEKVALDSITFKSFDTSKLFLNFKSKNFRMEANDKSEAELTLLSEKASLIFSQNSILKAIISATDLIADLYQKAEGKLEGNATNAVLRADSNTELNASKLAVKNLTLVAEGSSEAKVNAETTIAITATGKAAIDLYGDAKIEIKKFTGEVKLHKK